MAEDLKLDQGHIKIEEDVATPAAATPVETTDRGLFDFMGKKKEEKKPHEETIATEFDEKLNVSEPEKKQGGLLEKLHRSGSSSSSSSSEEEVEEEGKKIRRKKDKKGLKEKIKEKISGDKKEGEHETHVPVEKCEETVHVESAGLEGEEKKGFLDKIKGKLPGGGQKKPEEVAAPAPPAAECPSPDSEAKEKKGFLEKIKEKLPGYHTKTEEEKEKEGHPSH